MHRWLPARCKAFELRKEVEDASGYELYGKELLQAIISLYSSLELVPVVHNDPLLGGKEGKYCQAKYILDEGIIVVNKDASPQDFNLYLAHELGHHFLHTRPDICNSEDVSPERLVFTLPYAEGRIATYNSYQAQENEANVFASELLMPSFRVAEKFDAGANVDTLAEFFQVSKYSILSQMASVLLEPSVDFGSVLKTQDAPIFHWHNLDDSQREAACISEGPVQVDAGPGTGKTRTLTSRVEWLIEKQTPPESILILTFSNKASGEIYDRLKKVIPNCVHQVTVTTFHGFGLELLRRYCHLIDLKPDFTVLDPVDAELLLVENLDKLNLFHFSDPIFPDKNLASNSVHGTILDFISKIRQEIITPEKFDAFINQMTVNPEDKDIEKYREIAHVYHIYEQIKRSTGFVDYEDLVILPVLIFLSNPLELAQLKSQYQHVLVDEYQDINRANGELIKLLVGPEAKGLWVVGDLRQSIYRWRGASPTYLRDFQLQYPLVKKKQLNINYRSTQKIVDYLNIFVKSMKLPIETSEWKSYRGNVDNSHIKIIEANDENDEVQGVIDTIQKLVANGHYKYKDFAILCRRNSDANSFADYLTLRNVPVLHFGNFFDRVEIHDLLAVVDLSTDFQGISWIRVAQILEYPLTRQHAVNLWQQIYSQKIAFPQGLKVIAETPELNQQQQGEITELAEILLKYQHSPLANPWLILADFLFEYGRYVRNLRSNLSQNISKLLAIGQLLNLAKSFSQRSKTKAYQSRSVEFLDHIRALVARADGDIVMPTLEEDIDAVRILTIHKAKGLEFPIIFVPTLAKGVFPSSHSTRPIMDMPNDLLQNTEPNGKELEEENCLFVALSRARDILIISRPKRRNAKNSNPSELWTLLDSNTAIKENWEQFEKLELPTYDWHEDVSDETLHNLNTSAIRVAEYCLRQFYYQYGLGLKAVSKRTLYREFHSVMTEIIQWIQNTLRDEKTLEWENIQDRYTELFDQIISDDHVHKSWYKDEGLQQLRNFWRQVEVRHKAGKSIHNFPITINVKDVDIDIQIDEIFESEEGHQAFYHRIGKKKSSLNNRLALYRQALLEAGYESQIAIHTHSLSDDVLSLSKQQDEKKAFAKLEKQLESMRDGYFPPDPPQYKNSTCAKCRFLFICPT